MPQHIIEGLVAPAFTPSSVGQHYVDTVTGIEYISTGTASSADWKARAAAVAVEDEGGSVDTAAETIDFVGAGVVASQTAPGAVQVTIAGGGGGGSGHPATRSYLIDYVADDGTAGMETFLLESADGGQNWSIVGPGNAAAPGASDRLVTDNNVQHDRVSNSVGDGFFIWSGLEYGGTANRQSIRATFDKGANWRMIANAENHPANSGLAGKGAAYDGAFAYAAWDGATDYAVLCQESGTNDYVRDSTDSGVTWNNIVISGSLLTDIETVNWYPCMDGFWYAYGVWWAALQFDDGAGNQQVRIYQSADRAAWTTFWTSPFNTLWSWNTGGGPTYANGIGRVVTPTLGTFIHLSNQSTFQYQIYRLVDSITAPALVADASTVLSATGGFTIPHPGGHGYAIDPATVTERAFGVAQTANVDRLMWTEDGTTWNEGVMPDFGSSPANMHFLDGWDGFSHVFSQGSSSPVIAKCVDGKIVTPHQTINAAGRMSGSTSGLPDFLSPAEGNSNCFYGIVD